MYCRGMVKKEGESNPSVKFYVWSTLKYSMYINILFTDQSERNLRLIFINKTWIRLDWVGLCKLESCLWLTNWNEKPFLVCARSKNLFHPWQLEPMHIIDSVLLLPLYLILPFTENSQKFWLEKPFWISHINLSQPGLCFGWDAVTYVSMNVWCWDEYGISVFCGGEWFGPQHDSGIWIDIIYDFVKWWDGIEEQIMVFVHEAFPLKTWNMLVPHCDTFHNVW